MNEIISYIPQGMTEIKEFCAMVAKSNIVPKEFIGKPENVFVACLKGMDLGLKPLQALECIAVINGKTSLYGDSYLAIARGSGKLESYREEIIGEGDKMKCQVSVKRKGEDAITGEYNAGDAKTAGLWGKSGPWSLHPKRMLTMKARNYALRAAFADLFLGLEYSVEELQEVEDAKRGSKPSQVNNAPKDITPTHVEVMVEGILNEDRSMYKIDGSFMSGMDLNDLISEKISSILTISDMESYEIWKSLNNDGIKSFCKDNKDMCIGFAEDIKAKRSLLQGE